MPVYSFVCDKDDGGCGFMFSVTCSICNYDKMIEYVKCPDCTKYEFVHRNFTVDELPMISISTTLGSLCDKNSGKMSVDEKHHLKQKHYEYRGSEDANNVLPEGMRRGRDVAKELKNK